MMAAAGRREQTPGKPAFTPEAVGSIRVKDGKRRERAFCFRLIMASRCAKAIVTPPMSKAAFQINPGSATAIEKSCYISLATLPYNFTTPSPFQEHTHDPPRNTSSNVLDPFG